MEAFYATNRFSLHGEDEIDHLLLKSPHAKSMRRVMLLDVPPISLYDQREVEIALQPVDLLAKKCTKLKDVAMLGEITSPRVDSCETFGTIPRELNLQLVVFKQPRYSFRLCAWTPALDIIWKRYIEDEVERHMGDQAVHIATLLLAMNNRQTRSGEDIITMAAAFVGYVKAGLDLCAPDHSEQSESINMQFVPETFLAGIRSMAQRRPANGPPFRKSHLMKTQKMISWLNSLSVAAYVVARTIVPGEQDE